MCGRYTLWDLDMLAERFDVAQTELDIVREEIHESYNIAPTQQLPTITAKTKKRHIELMRWGFVAPWMRDIKDTFIQ